MANQPKSYRKFLAGSVTAALVASAVSPVAAEEAAASNFSDVPASSSHFDNINKAVEYELMKGYPDNTFKPDKSLTRSDVVKTLSRYLVDIHGEGDIENIDLSDVEAFNDVPEDYQDGELYQASLVVKKYGVFTGANGNLNPTHLITRQAMAKVLVGAFDLELKDDVESKVTDNEVADEEFRGFINILSENGVTAVTEFRPKEDTSRAQFASFLVRAYEEVISEEVELAVESVSAINNTTFELTVLLSGEVTAAGLQGKSISLTKGSVTADATFTSLDGQVATFTVDSADRSSLVDGDYAVSATWAELASGLTSNYSAVISGNYIEGFVYETTGTGTVGLFGAEVTVDGKSYETDANGYYKIATNPGEVKTVASYGENTYFVTPADVKVSRNNTSAQNFEMTKVVESQLMIEGTVVNETTGEVVGLADVTLQTQDADGNWVDLATVDAGSDGVYQIGNSASGAADHVFSTNKIKLGQEYRVVISKDLAWNNLTDVYEEKTVTVKPSVEKAKTSVLTKIRPIAELEDLNVNVKWDSALTSDGSAATLYNSAADTLGFTLLGTDGKEILISADADPRDANGTSLYGVPYDFAAGVTGVSSTSFDADSNSLKDAINLAGVIKAIGSDGAYPTLPTGTYYLLVDDGVNAKAVVPVEITEGTEKTVDATFTEAGQVNTQVQVKNLKYATDSLAGLTAPTDLLPIGVNYDGVAAVAGADLEAQAITPTVNFYKKLNGVNVLVHSIDEKPAGVDGVLPAEAFVYTSNNPYTIETPSQAATRVEQDATYVIEYASEYVRGTNSAEVSLTGESLTNTISVDSASKIGEINIAPSDAATTSDTTLNIDSIELLNESGEVVATASDLSGAMGTTVTFDETNYEEVFQGLEPGKYKVRVTADGYETKTSNEFTVLDFHNVGAVIDQIALEAIPANVVSGYVRYADDYAVVADGDASIYVYDGTTLVDAQNVTTGKFNFSGLKEGKTYTFVVRGGGHFETTAQEFKVEKGVNGLNFEVTRGGEGLAMLTVVDEQNNDVNWTQTPDVANDVVLQDKWYVTFTDADGTVLDLDGDGSTSDETALSTTVSGLNDNGEYALSLDGTKVFGVAATDALLSEGQYRLVVEGTDDTYGLTDTITISDVNATQYGVYKVDLIDASSELTYKVSGEIVEADQGSDPTQGFVVAYNKSGEVVDSVFATNDPGNTEYTLELPANAEYTIKVFVNSDLVDSKKVTVQDFDIENFNFNLREATR
jgi:hypothetical protein